MTASCLVHPLKPFKDKATRTFAPLSQHMRRAIVNRNLTQSSFSLALRNGDPPSVRALVNIANLERTEFIQPRACHQGQTH